MSKRLFIKVVSVFVSINMLTQVFYPTVAFALTGGPSQPEMQNFEPVDQTEMVDLSTGNFSYNIPLMDVEGYPINLSYHSGITMDQEASWVGLGWNINPGEINRQVRGLPDDFNGDQVTQSYNMKPNITVGFNEGAKVKTLGFPITGTANIHAGVFYNNYNGPGLDFGYTSSLSAGVANEGSLTAGLSMGMGLDFNSQSGLDISRSIGMSLQMADDNNNNNSLDLTVGTSYNSREGIKALTISKDIEGSTTNNSKATTTIGESIESGYSFTNPTYIPSISMPINNYALTLQFGAGTELIGLYLGLDVSGYATIQSLVNSTVSHPAFGYMNSDQANNDANALHDFNREKDVPYQPTMANLPITNFTYDLYNASAEGMQVQFRPFRGDVGILYDHQNSNQSLSGSVGEELGFADVVHLGIDVGFSYSNTNRDRWTADNVFNSAVSFASLQYNNISYEPYYFKGTGEKSVNDTSYYKSINGTSPMYVQINQYGADVTAQSIFTNGGNVNSIISGNLKKTRREKRNRSLSLLTAAEATDFAVDKTINSYPYNKNVYDSGCASLAGITQYSRISHPAHHTSEITVTNDDGRRFVYGIPAYNTLQKEVSFAVQSPGNSGNYPIDTNNLVNYTEGTDNSINNKKDIDNYYNAQQLPPYAHSYLLTEVLSPDYVDLTNNGVTDDDLGQAVRFNYTCMYNQGSPYHWRVPYQKDTANYQQQYVSYNQYDKGNYIYGNKEIWYVHSIESKTMVAQFILGPIGSRRDALGVHDEDGGKDTTQKQQYLKEIDLYSKADLIKNGSRAVPIKTAHFVYDYKLCHGTPSSIASDSTGHNGKLTLIKVYFTYGNNNEGALNSYSFNYSSVNPSYSNNQMDRWGNYKYNPSGMPPNMYFPYTLQDSVRTNSFATAWELTNITLPSGGTIKVNYESNDYAYVQNQRAGQMFIVKGANSVPASTTNGQLYYYDHSANKYRYNDWIIVSLPTSCTNTKDFYNKYLAGISKLYFRFLVDVDHNGHYEYVPGYADIAADSLINSTTGAIKLSEETNTGSKDVPSANEIALASWQYARLNLPGYAYPGSNTMSGSLSSMIMAVGSIITDIADMVAGFDLRALVQNFGKNFIPGYSVLRLDNPTYKKYGGGCRVKEMDFSDSWATMTDSLQTSFTYGQTYNYTTTITNAGGKIQTISSGVATYEPLLGGDENSLRQPLPYDEKYLLAPNNNYYTETPLGEDLYPAPGIVYSKVTVANLKYPGVNRTATGYTVDQFYTAYDFPTLTDKTSLVNCPYKPSFLLSLLSIGIQNFTTASMGFTVEVNDMAGKLKKQEVCDKNGSPISSIEYDYKVDNSSAPNMHLNNNVSVANPDGTIGKASVGLDIDTWEDMREEDSQTYGIDISFNDDIFVIIPPVPLNSFTIWPSFSSEHTRFRSAVTTKYIHRTGLLDHVIKTENGSQVTSQNLLYDSETGDVLLTETSNEFNKPIYNFTYPAHWAYDAMGSAYRNIGVYVEPVTTNSSGVITTPSLPGNFFAPGDELEFYRPKVGFSDSTAWVTQPQATGNYVIMDKNGKPIVMNNCFVKVIRSGRRNMQSIPIGQVTSMLSPAGSKKLFMNDSLQILQANATLFNNTWKVPNTNILKQVCSSTGGPPDSCIARFFDSLEVHGQVYAAPGDSIKFGKYAPACTAYSNELYFALSERSGEDQTTLFQAQLGNCVITITPYAVNYDRGTGTKLLSMDSLGTFIKLGIEDVVYVPPGDAIQGTDTTGGCINLYGEYLPGLHLNRDCGCGAPLLYQSYKLKGKMCISCMTCTNVCSNVSVDSTMNPYTIGLLGNWRPERNYLYYDTRSPALASTNSDIWKTGIYNHFNPLWKLSSGTWNPDTAATSDKNWVWPSHVTMYDTKGNEIEEQNTLGVYSSALFGYIQSMPVATSSNAKYKDIASDGFEDYGFNNTCSSPCDSGHFDFKGAISTDPTHVDTTSSQSHTGKYSLKISSGHSATVSRSINYFNGAVDSTTSTKFIMLPGGTLPLFSPDSGSYLLSAWVKEGVACGVTGYTQDSIVVNYTGSTAKYIMKPSGPVIEGWQRFESRFKVPKAATKITVELVAGSNTAYYDDIRIEPFAAEMETYVYDPSSLRTLAVLDVNNYATIYEYNDEGVLLRVKKETERGIKTIKETRSSYPRK